MNLQIDCPRGCGMSFSLRAKESHVREVCSLRMVQCEACWMEVRANFLGEHQLYECEVNFCQCKICFEKVRKDGMEAGGIVVPVYLCLF